MKTNPELIDNDSPEWTDDMFKQAKPASEVLPTVVAALGRGRPKNDNPKVSTTIRLSPDVIDYFKNEGKGWQSRIDKALKEYVDSHQ
jgi:uncharacterized protein (DUF4415 family)